MGFFHYGWLPISVTFIALATFFACYGIGVRAGHIRAYFPYISDTGGYRYESCIFTLGCTIASFLSLATCFLRYHDVKCRIINSLEVEGGANNVVPLRLKFYKKLEYINYISLWLGLIAAIGLSLVASFQDTSSLILLHLTGALGIFGAGLIWSSMQTYISFYLEYKHLTYLRIFLGAVSFVAIILYCACGIYSHRLSPHVKHGKWDEDDLGFHYHIVSAISEWVLAISFMFYYTTFYSDFSKLKINISLDRSSPYKESMSLEDSPREPGERRPLLSNGEF